MADSKPNEVLVKIPSNAKLIQTLVDIHKALGKGYIIQDAYIIPSQLSVEYDIHDVIYPEESDNLDIKCIPKITVADDFNEAFYEIDFIQTLKYCLDQNDGEHYAGGLFSFFEEYSMLTCKVVVVSKDDKQKVENIKNNMNGSKGFCLKRMYEELTDFDALINDVIEDKIKEAENTFEMDIKLFRFGKIIIQLGSYAYVKRDKLTLSKIIGKIKEIEDMVIKCYIEYSLYADKYIHMILLCIRAIKSHLILIVKITNEDSKENIENLFLYSHDRKGFSKLIDDLQNKYPEKLNTILVHIGATKKLLNTSGYMTTHMREQSIRAAISSIMARNVSHNIGSHVLANVLSDNAYFDNEIRSLIRHLQENRKDSHILDNVLNDNAYFDSDIRSLILYVQQRQDFIAQIATIWSTRTDSSWFVKEILRYFLYQKYLLSYMGSSEGLREHCYNKNDIKNDIRISVFSLCSEVWNENIYSNNNEIKDDGLNLWCDKVKAICDETRRTLKRCNICTERCSKEGDSKCEPTLLLTKKQCHNFNFNNDFYVAIPGGIIGHHAFFTIIENIIRNGSKHSYDKMISKYRECEVNGDNIELILSFGRDLNDHHFDLIIESHEFTNNYLFRIYDNVSFVSNSIKTLQEDLKYIKINRYDLGLMFVENDNPDQDICRSLVFVKSHDNANVEKVIFIHTKGERYPYECKNVGYDLDLMLVDNEDTIKDCDNNKLVFIRQHNSVNVKKIIFVENNKKYTYEIKKDETKKIDIDSFLSIKKLFTTKNLLHIGPDIKKEIIDVTKLYTGYANIDDILSNNKLYNNCDLSHIDQVTKNKVIDDVTSYVNHIYKGFNPLCQEDYDMLNLISKRLEKCISELKDTGKILETNIKNLKNNGIQLTESQEKFITDTCHIPLHQITPKALLQL